MPRTSHPHAMGLLAVLTVAVVVRLLYFQEIQHTPFFAAPVIDADFYHQLAQALARGEGTGRAPFMMPPLFPLVLSLLYRAFGVDLLLAHTLQFVFGTLTVLLTFLIARRFWGLPVAVLAGLLVATNRSLLFVEGDLLATPLAVLLDLAFVGVMLRLRQSGRWFDVCLGGVLLGLAALARPPVLVVLPGFAVWLAWRRRRPGAAVLLVLLSLAMLFPVALHNRRASGEWVWISANGGINFWIGNNPDMRRTVALRPGPEWRRMNDLPLRQDGRITPVQRDRWFWKEGMRAFVTDPVAAARRLFEKSILLVHDHEIMRDVDFYYFRRQYAHMLWLPFGNFAFLLALALVGSILVRPRSAPTGFLWLFLVPYALCIVAFFVTARYRAPLLPLMALAASVGLVWIWGCLRQRRIRALLAAAGLSAGVLLISLPDWYGVDAVDEVEARYRTATSWENAGNLQAALSGYEDVLHRDPTHALAGARAAGCLQRLGQVQEAVELYETVLQQHPEYVEVMLNLANLAWRFGDDQTARGYFVRAQEADPYYALPFGYHGMYLASRGAFRDALQLYAEALRLDPSWDLLRLDQARALLGLGRAADALEILQALPDALLRRNAQAHDLLGDTLQQLGRDSEAQQEWRRALQLDPRNRQLQEKLREP